MSKKPESSKKRRSTRQPRSNERPRPIPRFETEDQERDFWAETDATDYVDWSEARSLVFPDLKPTLRTISVRLPEPMIAALKILANKRDVPYQSLLKIFLAERVEEEMRRLGASGASAPAGPPR